MEDMEDDGIDISTEIPKHVLEAVRGRSLTNVRDSIRIKKTKEKEKMCDRERLNSLGSKNSLTRGEAGEVKSLMKKLSKSLSNRGISFMKKKRSPKKEIGEKMERNVSADRGDHKNIQERLSHIGSKQSITRDEVMEVQTLMKNLSAKLPLDRMRQNFAPDPELVREVQRNSSSDLDFRTDSIELQKQRNSRKATSDFAPDPELLAKVQRRSKGGLKQKVIRDSILITKTRQRVASSSSSSEKSMSPLIDAFTPPDFDDENC